MKPFLLLLAIQTSTVTTPLERDLTLGLEKCNTTVQIRQARLDYCNKRITLCQQESKALAVLADKPLDPGVETPGWVWPTIIVSIIAGTAGVVYGLTK